VALERRHQPSLPQEMVEVVFLVVVELVVYRGAQDQMREQILVQVVVAALFLAPQDGQAVLLAAIAKN
jgi:hypothetical protein